MTVKGRIIGEKFDDRIEEQFEKGNVTFWNKEKLRGGLTIENFTMVILLEDIEERQELLEQFTDSQAVFINHGFYAHTAAPYTDATSGKYGVQIWMQNLAETFDRAVERLAFQPKQLAFKNKEELEKLYKHFLNHIEEEYFDNFSKKKIDDWFRVNTILTVTCDLLTYY